MSRRTERKMLAIAPERISLHERIELQRRIVAAEWRATRANSPLLLGAVVAPVAMRYLPDLFSWLRRKLPGG